MRFHLRSIEACMAALVLLGVPVTGASAGVLSADIPGAALALPIFASANRSTVAIATNASDDPVQLRVLLIDGDDWEAMDAVCPLTARETTLFTAQSLGGQQMQLSFECTDPGGQPVAQGIVMSMEQGILFLSLEDPVTGDLSNVNSLFGDATVVDLGQGWTWSVPAILFQGGPVPAQENGRYRFDGVEYATFPSRVATEFLAPDADISAELILFTLDGTTRQTSGPRVETQVFFTDDDEIGYSAPNYEFDCFSVVPLTGIDPRFERSQLGSQSGFLTLRPVGVAQTAPKHDVLFDGGAGADLIRKTPIHGWLVQTFSTLGPSGTAYDAVARPLETDIAMLTPQPGDAPTLNAIPEPARLWLLAAGIAFLWRVRRRGGAAAREVRPGATRASV